jgi:glycosyltransferase involved in cell wall biosynthesis
MLSKITKHPKTPRESYPFCVLIPSWNNLSFLKLCVESIQKNAHFDLQIIVVVNDGSDGTIEWLEEIGTVDYVHSTQNVGICYGLNSTRSMIKSEYVVYVNDDMYLLPNWDLALYEEIQQLNTKQFMLSSTMIEPNDTGNPCVVVKDYGNNIANFKEEELLKNYQSLFREDWSGSSWPPNVVHIDLWDLVGGMSIEYSPGMYSDPDLARKLYQVGVRIFKGKGTSLAYHFGSKSTNRIKKNVGKQTFVLKWGVTASTFNHNYLHLGETYHGDITPPQLSTSVKILNKVKQILAMVK